MDMYSINIALRWYVDEIQVISVRSSNFLTDNAYLIRNSRPTFRTDYHISVPLPCSLSQLHSSGWVDAPWNMFSVNEILIFVLGSRPFSSRIVCTFLCDEHLFSFLNGFPSLPGSVKTSLSLGSTCSNSPLTQLWSTTSSTHNLCLDLHEIRTISRLVHEP